MEHLSKVFHYLAVVICCGAVGKALLFTCVLGGCMSVCGTRPGSVCSVVVGVVMVVFF